MTYLNIGLVKYPISLFCKSIILCNAWFMVNNNKVKGMCVISF